MSRQARWIGCEAAKPAVPLMPISVSMAPTQISVAREKSRMVRARNANDGGVGVCAVSTARRSNSSAASRSAAARASRTWMLVDLGDRIAAGAAARFGPVAELLIGALRGAQHRRDEGQGRIGDEGRAIDRMGMERAARAFALQEIGEPHRPAGRDEDAVANRGVAAGRPHADREPGVGDLEAALRPDEKERPFRRAAGLRPCRRAITHRLWLTPLANGNWPEISVAAVHRRRRGPRARPKRQWRRRALRPRPPAARPRRIG